MPPAAQKGAPGATQKKVNRNALSACGDSAAAKAAYTQVHANRELEISELSSLVGAAKSIANDVVSKAPRGSRVKRWPLTIDAHEACALQVIDGSRAAEALEKDLNGFGATVKQLYLSGPAGGVELRDQPAEHMDAEAPPSRLRAACLAQNSRSSAGARAESPVRAR